jgi:hypothetical protein
MKEQLIARWDTFLGKMRTRFHELLVQGEEAVLSSLDDNDYDYFGSLRVMQGIRMQMYNDLVQKVSETWQQQVEPLMRADGSYWAEQSYKGHALGDQMSEEIELWLYITEGKLSRKYYDHAIQLIDRDFFCTQCGSPLQIRKGFFMAQYVTCNHCSAVNTFEPETKYVTIGWNVVNSMAALHALEEYKVRHKDEHSLRRYYEKYFDERIKLMPHTAATRQQDIDFEVKKHLRNGNN